MFQNSRGFWELIYTADQTPANTQQLGYAVAASCSSPTFYNYQPAPIFSLGTGLPDPGNGNFQEYGGKFYLAYLKGIGNGTSSTGNAASMADH